MKPIRFLGEGREEIERGSRSREVGYSTGKPNQAPKEKTVFVGYNQGNTQGKIVNIEAAVVLPANKLRVSLFFQNRSSSTVYIGFGSNVGRGDATPPPVPAVELPAGAVLGFDQYCPYNDVYMSAEADGCLVTVIETISVQ